MSDSKRLRWDESFGRDAGQDPGTGDASLAGGQPAANDADGWQQYRHWISKAPTPKIRRSGIDPSLYSWRGYRDWADQVRRNWAKEPGEDER